MRDQANTLINTAWMADIQGDVPRARQAYLDAARNLAAIQAWPDLSTVLGNLGMLGKDGQEGKASHLAQAFWLCLFIDIPPSSILNLSRALLDKLDAQHQAAPLLAAVALLLVNERGKDHPDREALQSNALMLLARCAEARSIEAEQVANWFRSQQLNDPAYCIPELQKALIAIVGDDEWLFDPLVFSDRA